MSQSIPGPWEVLYTADENPGDGFTECRVVTKSNVDNPARRTIAILCDDVTGNRNKENARLIAAAPEMLALLKRMHALLTDKSSFEKVFGEGIKAAIAKAEGRDE